MTEKVIVVEGLTKVFNSHFTAVDHISFTVDHGEIFGFLGPNGVGKTTTIKMLCTLLISTEGKAEIDGYDVMKDADEVRKKIGVVTEKLIAYDAFTPMENLSVFGRLYGMKREKIRDRSEELMKLVELWDFKNTRIGSFSTGMRQRFNIIRALLHDPDIIFLDDPTIGLDPTTSHKVSDFIKHLNTEQEKTLILTI